MNLNHKTDYQTGDQLTATAWNNLAADVNELGASGVGGGVVSTEVDAEDANKTFVKVGTVTVAELTSKGDKGTNVGLSGDNNINIEPRPAAGDGSGKNTPGLANRKGGNIALKPGDDIEFWAHKRGTSKSDEVSVKMLTEVPKASDPTKTDEVAAKLQLNAADIVLTSKDKQSDTDVMNITVNKAANTRGYLKVRAQAIDLRCEDHGGIALQPKGQDGQGNMNKIKFEHGGGDGLEFGTFNTEKTSIFTDEYRFNREGVWKMATRQTTASDKADVNDDTTALKYVKQADDFYDVIAQDDEQCTTKDIIKTAYVMNGGKDRHTKITNKGAIEVATNVTWTIHITTDNGSAVNVNTISDEIAALDSVSEGMAFNEGDFKVSGTAYTPSTTDVYTNGTQYFEFVEVAAPAIKIESGGELKLGGILDFGSSFNFGETDNGIEFQYKLTKKNAEKDCGVLKVVGVNNHATNNLVVEGLTIAPGQTGTIAQCSVLDIIKLVNYMKTNNQGPWENVA